MKSISRFCFLDLLASLLAPAQDLKEFEKKVSEFTLANGLHFIIIERHEAPVVSFNTYVKAGSLTVAAGSRMRGQVEFGWDNEGRSSSARTGS